MRLRGKLKALIVNSHNPYFQQTCQGGDIPQET